ncbi:MAG: Carboxylesterase YbfK [Anaerolineales bacterium]|nr:Carboxylesterase YbfK [Anaerolineales bacterium]
MEDAYLAARSFKSRPMVNPTVLTDAELRSIGVPALFLVGENEKIYSAQEAVERLNEVAPQIETDIIPDAGHDLTLVQADLVNRIVLAFLKEP